MFCLAADFIFVHSTSVAKRKGGEITSSKLDASWPYQVALRAEVTVVKAHKVAPRLPLGVTPSAAMASGSMCGASP